MGRTPSYIVFLNEIQPSHCMTTTVDKHLSRQHEDEDENKESNESWLTAGYCSPSWAMPPHDNENEFRVSPCSLAALPQQRDLLNKSIMRRHWLWRSYRDRFKFEIDLYQKKTQTDKNGSTWVWTKDLHLLKSNWCVTTTPSTHNKT